MTFEFTDDAKLWEKRLACLERLKSARVDVGLTSSASGRSRFLLGIHEHGSPAMRIPARPVIAPAEDTQLPPPPVAAEPLEPEEIPAILKTLLRLESPEETQMPVTGSLQSREIP